MEKDIESLLDRLADATAEPVDAAIAELIKQQIPQKLGHRHGFDTINIIIDLRISKLAAAAVILLTLFVCGALLGGRGGAGEGIIDEIRYSVAAGRATKAQMAAGVAALHEYLLKQGKEVVYYGDGANKDDNDAILMHWKLDDGNYKVIFADFRTRTVSGAELIRLQARMIQEKVQ